MTRNRRLRHAVSNENSRRSLRRGVTVILVLGLLAATLAVSYAMMRTQVTSLQIQTNLDRRDDARQAALTGMATALRRIHETSWQGVDVPLSGTLAGGAGFDVAFVTGDAALVASDPAYAEFPFRVTINCTGYASETGNSGRRAEYRVQTVVQLVRRAFASQPSGWTDLQNFTLVQWDDDDSIVQFPVRIEGAAKLGGQLNFCETYPDHNSSLERYLKDLERMRVAGLGDNRPFSGPVHLPYNRTSGSTRNLLTDELNLTTIDVDRGGSAPLTHPNAPATYRLYAGGKTYSIPAIQSTWGYELENLTIGPDPATNPLGVFRSTMFLLVKDGVTLRASIITSGYEPDIHLSGQNITWDAPELPRLYGQAAAEKNYLPAALVKDDFRVYSGAKATINGALAVWDEMEVQEGDAQTQCAITGRVFTDELFLRGRSSWIGSSTWWSLGLQAFLAAYGSPGSQLYFPGWTEKYRGLTTAPKITIRPGATTNKHRWVTDWSQPIYVPHSSDTGLVWDLLRWNESPVL